MNDWWNNWPKIYTILKDTLFLQNSLQKQEICTSEMIFFVLVRLYRTLVEMEQCIDTGTIWQSNSNQRKH